MKLPTRIILVDDHPIIRECIRFILNRNSDTTVIGEADNGKSAVRIVKKLKPDVVIMDIMLPILNGIEATRQILKLRPNTKIIALSAHFQKVFLKNMLSAGACGYVLKDSLYSELLPAISEVKKNKIYISRFLVEKFCILI